MLIFRQPFAGPIRLASCDLQTDRSESVDGLHDQVPHPSHFKGGPIERLRGFVFGIRSALHSTKLSSRLYLSSLAG